MVSSFKSPVFGIDETYSLNFDVDMPVKYQNHFYQKLHGLSRTQIVLIGMLCGAMCFVLYIGCKEFYNFQQRRFRQIAPGPLPSRRDFHI